MGTARWRLDRFGLRADKSRMAVTWENEGSYPFPYRDVALCVHGPQVRRALIDGVEVAGADNCFAATPLAEALFEF
jgi:alpha-glucosidase